MVTGAVGKPRFLLAENAGSDSRDRRAIATDRIPVFYLGFESAVEGLHLVQTPQMALFI